MSSSFRKQVMLSGSMVALVVLASRDVPATSPMPVRAIVEAALAATDPPMKPKLPAGTIPVSLPPILAADSIGYLPASSGVASDGAFTVSIPLDVPAGRAGMQPNLALTYSSNGGNGPLGVGWSVSGASEIARCGKTLSQEGVVDSMNFHDDDALCLDGQKLVAVNGVYGAVGTEYRTENDELAKIVSSDLSPLGPDTFTVWTRSGRILTYTAHDTPRVVGTAGGVTLVDSLSIQDTSARISWVLSRQEDRAGNAITYEYDIRTGGPSGLATEILPSRIAYTSHANGEPAHREVRFVYEDRPDTSLGWHAGIGSQLTRRLHAIEMYAPNPSATGKVWDYTFTYEAETSPGSRRSLLHAVRKCGAEGGCLWSKEFDWIETAAEPLFAETTLGPAPLSLGVRPTGNPGEAPLPPYAAKAGMKVFDFDGDGADDLLYRLGDEDTRHFFRRSLVAADGTIDALAIAGVFNAAESGPYEDYQGVDWASIRPIDADGNGEASLWVDGLGGHATLNWNAIAGTFTGSWTAGAAQYGGGLFADLDGDRRVSANEYVHAEDVADHAYPDDEEPDVRLLVGNTDTGIDPGCPLRFVDLDGDGRTDVLTKNNTSTTGGCSGPITAIRRDDAGQLVSAPFDFPDALIATQFADFNGDGLDDALLLPRGADAAVAPALWWNTGNGFYPDPHALAIPHDDYAADTHGNAGDIGIRIADMNGDGRADIVAFHATPAPAITLMLSNGDGTFRTHDYAFDPGTPVPSDDGSTDLPIGNGMRGWTTSQLGDFDGDGRVDLVRIVNGELRLLTQTPTFTDRIDAVFDEGTAWPRESVTYSNRWDDTAHAYACNYPLRCIKKGFTVVRKLESRAHWVEPAAGSPVYGVEYRYADPIVDVRGRGFLGFGERRIWDPQQPAETVITSDHRTRVCDPNAGTRCLYPYAGVPEVVTTSVPILTPDELAAQPAGAKLRITQTTTVSTTRWLNGTKTYRVEPESRQTQVWERSGYLDWTDVYQSANTTQRHVWTLGAAPAPLTTVQSTFAFDDFGNALNQSSTTLDGTSTAMRSTFLNDTADWLIGLPLTREVTATEAGGAPPVTRSTEYATNARGQIETLWIEKNDPALYQTTTFTYDPTYGLPTGATASGVGALPRTLHYEYDPLYPGAPDEKVFASQVWATHGGAYQPSQWLVVHPAYGVPQMTIDANLNVSAADYDDLGRVRRIEPAVGEPTKIVYAARIESDGSANGLVVTSQTGPRIATAEEDALGRTLSATTTGFAGETIRQDAAYDLRGAIRTQTRPYTPGHAVAALMTEWSFDSLGRPLAVVGPDGSAVRHSYTYFQTHTWDALDHESVVTRDADGRTIATAHIDNGAPITTTFDYAPFGLLERVTDAQGNIVQTEYDARGRATRQIDPDTGTSERLYTGLGDVLSEQHLATNETIDFVYDDLGRVVTRTGPEGTTTYEWDTSTNGAGQLAWSRSPDGIVRKSRYDGYGRVIGQDLIDETSGEHFALDVAYDAIGRLATLAYPDAPGRERFTLKYQYNPAGYLREIGEATANQSYARLWTADQRNVDFALTAGTLGNGVTLTRSYDALTGRLNRLFAADTAGTPVFDLGYAYELNGLVRQRSDAIAARDETFQYDALGRLRVWDLDQAGAQSQTEYAYDTIGNLTDVLKNGVASEHNDYGVNGGQPHTLTTRHDLLAGTTAPYHYDALGRMDDGAQRQTLYTSFDLPRTITKNGKNWTFAYDAGQARTKKTGPDGTTLYMDGLYERRDAGGVRKHVYHVHGTDGDVAEVIYDESTHGSVVDYTLQDALGSTGVVLDKAGQIGQRTFYEPFGARINADGSPFNGTTGDVTKGFTGHEHDEALGLINMNGRLYDPTLRRFLSADPIVSAPTFGQSWNPYSYVLNSPINLSDPSGFTWCTSNACVYKDGSYGQAIAQHAVDGGFGADAGYRETHGAPQEYGSGVWESLGSDESAAGTPVTAVASPDAPTVTRDADGTPTVCSSAYIPNGVEYTCTVVHQESDIGAYVQSVAQRLSRQIPYVVDPDQKAAEELVRANVDHPPAFGGGGYRSGEAGFNAGLALYAAVNGADKKLVARALGRAISAYAAGTVPEAAKPMYAVDPDEPGNIHPEFQVVCGPFSCEADATEGRIFIYAEELDSGRVQGFYKSSGKNSGMPGMWLPHHGVNEVVVHLPGIDLPVGYVVKPIVDGVPIRSGDRNLSRMINWLNTEGPVSGVPIPVSPEELNAVGRGVGATIHAVTREDAARFDARLRELLGDE